MSVGEDRLTFRERIEGVGCEPEFAFLRRLQRRETAKSAWSVFIQRYSGLILHTIREFESDYDDVLDRYLYVCQKLAEHDFHRFKKFQRGGQKEFSAWLRAVTRNLCIDYLRQQRGRRRLPRQVARLSALDQEVFQAVYWQGHSAPEAFEILRGVDPRLGFSQVLSSLRRIEACIRPRKLAQMAHPHRQLLSKARPGASDEAVAQIPNGRPDPEAELLIHEKIRSLEEAVSSLPESDRLLLRLRFEMGLTLEQTAAASGQGDHRKAHERLVQILEKLRERLSAQGWQ